MQNASTDATNDTDATNFSEPYIDPESYHRHIAERYLDTPCDIRERQPYPYDCVRKELEPNANVVYCVAHLAWWIDGDYVPDRMEN